MKNEVLPDNLEDIGHIMTNFDHTIEPDAEDRLKVGGVYGGYPGWHFYALVWWDAPLFKAMVKQYRTHVNTIEAESLQGIMDIACEYYGRK